MLILLLAICALRDPPVIKAPPTAIWANTMRFFLSKNASLSQPAPPVKKNTAHNNGATNRGRTTIAKTMSKVGSRHRRQSTLSKDCLISGVLIQKPGRKSAVTRLPVLTYSPPSNKRHGPQWSKRRGKRPLPGFVLVALFSRHNLQFEAKSRILDLVSTMPQSLHSTTKRGQNQRSYEAN